MQQRFSRSWKGLAGCVDSKLITAIRRVTRGQGRARIFAQRRACRPRQGLTRTTGSGCVVRVGRDPHRFRELRCRVPTGTRLVAPSLATAMHDGRTSGPRQLPGVRLRDSREGRDGGVPVLSDLRVRERATSPRRCGQPTRAARRESGSSRACRTVLEESMVDEQEVRYTEGFTQIRERPGELAEASTPR